MRPSKAKTFGWGAGGGRERLRAVGESLALLARCGVPDSNRAVGPAADRDEGFAVGEGQRPRPAAVSREAERLLAGGHVPEADGAVAAAARGSALPSGVKRNGCTPPAGLVTWCSTAREAASKSLSESPLAAASLLPSGENWMWNIVFSSLPDRASSLPVGTSHRIRVLPMSPEATRLPSGDTATPLPPAGTGKLRSSFPVAACHALTVRSQLAEATTLPSAE